MLSAIHEIQKLEGFEEADKLVKERRYGEAVEKFGKLLAELVEEHGDLGLAMAPVYYGYGSACLLQVETSANIFGDAVKHKKEVEAEAAEVNEGEEDGEDDEADTEKAGEDAKDDQDGPVDDLMQALMEEYKKQNNKEPTDEVLKKWAEQLKDVTMEKAQAEKQQEDLSAEDIEELLSIAWECLESSRVIYKKALENENADAKEKKELTALLAKTLLRLGDHSMECGKFDQSIDDYEQCLGLRKEIFDAGARELADVYATLAHAYLYSSAEDTDLSSARFKRLKAASAYTNAASNLLLLRQKTLGAEMVQSFDTEIFLPEKPVKVVEEEDEEEEEIEDGDKGKGKKSKAEEEKPLPPLSEDEVKSIKSVRARIENIDSLLGKDDDDETKCDKEEAEKAAQELSGLIDDLKEKIFDVLLVLENEEASEAMTKSAEVVEEALEMASSALSGSKENDAQGDGPTNLLQARKKASSPEDVAQEMEEATSEAEKAEAAEKSTKQENEQPQKRKASDLNDTESAAVAAKKVKV